MFLIKMQLPKVARGMMKALTEAKREAWRAVGEHFHSTMRDKRFTTEHARKAGYYLRKGEGMPQDSKRWRASYTGRKFATHGHTRPLEFSGDTRRAVRTARITFTGNGTRIAYPGARTFNFRNKASRIRMNEEFRRVTREEQVELAGVFDRRLEQVLQRLQATP